MRVAKKEIRDKEAIEGILEKCEVGRLGTIGRDGYPMVKPLNYIYLNGAIYFHSAREGEKIEDVGRDNRVCFEVDIPIAYVKSTENPCKAEYLYQSVIIKGRAHIVEAGDERLRALEALMKKYQPEGGYGTFPEDKLALTTVVRIDVTEMTGKQDLGKQ
jgi:nitroimidazol reductase NimA-like FMN-containing flavoprotein (pyridoxamine 5'-phosphate oxidase superfamily)